MAVKDAVKAIRVAAFNAAGLDPAVWQEITPVGGLPGSCFLIIIKNLSNRVISVSYDNNHVHDVIAADSIFELNLQTNAQPNGQACLMKKGTDISLKGAINGAGFIYLSGYYQEEQY